MDVDKARLNFPILKRQVQGQPLIYFDNAATSQKPRQVIDAVSSYYAYSNANIHRGVHTLGDEASSAYEAAREKVRRFINARRASEIIFVRNATEGINLVAKSWGEKNICSKDGEGVLTTEMEHHSNIIPWMILVNSKSEYRNTKQIQNSNFQTENAKGTAQLEFVRVNESGELDLQDLENKLKQPQPPKLLTLTHVSNVLSTINPIKKIVKLARRVSPQTKILVDAAQSVPHQRVDVASLGCDFLVFSGHKMLAPMGIGVLYVREEVLQEMPPFLTGGDMIKQVHFDGVEWNDLPAKFEAGTPNVAGAVGLSAAIDYLAGVGMEKIHQHEQELVEYLLDKLLEPSTLNLKRPLSILGPRELGQRAGLISFNIEGIAPHDLAAFLDTQGVAVRSGFHCAQPLHEKLGCTRGSVRVSFYLYNTMEEVDQFVAALEKAIQVLG